MCEVERNHVRIRVRTISLPVMETTDKQTSGRGYYHICSDGNHSSVLFLDEDDFKAAMNRVAVCALRLKVVIVAFVLMDNHFHFIIRARSKEEAIRFANEFKRLTGIYQSHKYGRANSLVHLPVKVLFVDGSDYLKTVICYVIKNPTKARLGMFYDYPWGTGGLYFRNGRRATSGSRSVGSFSQEAIRALCKTRVAIPKDWLICDGVLLPENYVAIGEAEQLLRSPRAYMFFLSLNKDDDIEREFGDWNDLRLTDSELRQERDSFIRQRFGQCRFRDLAVPDRLKVARYLRHKYLCSKKQIARIVQLPLETVDNNLQ